MSTVEYRITQLDEHVWAIDEEGFVQCYLIEGTERTLLFDCCLSGGVSFKQTVDSLTDKPIQLVFSHTDGDHTGAQEFFDAPMLHPCEFDYYVSKGNAGKQVRPIWEGDVIDLGDTQLEVVLIPGHTPGHIALLNRAARRIFVGDTISDRHIFMFGPGRNLDALVASLHKLEALVPEFDTVHACHGSNVLEPDWVGRTRIAAEKLAAGELEGHDPPRPLPCHRYSYDGVNLLYP
jgi:glyoxylase-like metal-dependent hydrolase (beta-lactamase superfamily II)